MNEGVTSQPVRVRDMPFAEFMKLMRMIGPEVKRLALRGDKFAQAVFARYLYAHEHPGDQKADMECRTAVEDYINRDLRLTEQLDLGSKFGHRLPTPEKELGPHIFMPGPDRAQ